MLCVISGRRVPDPVQPHHYKTVGAGGSDEDENLDRLLPKFHREAHRIGIKQFAIKYALEKPRKILLKKGEWSIKDEEAFCLSRAKIKK